MKKNKPGFEAEKWKVRGELLALKVYRRHGYIAACKAQGVHRNTGRTVKTLPFLAWREPVAPVKKLSIRDFTIMYW